jgi:outer membrane autotransporter protein
MMAALNAADTQYHFDTDDNTVVLRDYPVLTENFVSTGREDTDGSFEHPTTHIRYTAATGNRIILNGRGNFYVDVITDKERFPSTGNFPNAGWDSMVLDGESWMIASDVTLVGASDTALHIVSGSHVLGGARIGNGKVYLPYGGVTIEAGAYLQVGQNGVSGDLDLLGNVVNNGVLRFARDSYEFKASISGLGRLYWDGSFSPEQTWQTGRETTLVLTGSNSYSGGTYILAGILEVKNSHALGTGRVDFFTSFCTLGFNFADKPADMVLNNELTGIGRIAVDLGSGTNVFKFGDAIGDKFSGNLFFTRGTLDMRDMLPTSLAQTNVRLENQTTLTLASGTTLMKNLTLNSGTANTSAYGANARKMGTLAFDVDLSTPNPLAPVESSVLSVANLTGTSVRLEVTSGTVRLDATDGQPAGLLPLPSGSVFEQDDMNIVATLIKASGTVNLEANKLTLVDKNNAVISNAQTQTVVQGTAGSVATATYDYRLTTGAANDGLYANYGLTKLDIVEGKTFDLANPGGNSISANTLTAAITSGSANGGGSLVINGRDTLWLSGTGSSYYGTTVVNSGTIVFGSSGTNNSNNGALGNTTGLRVKSGAHIDMNDSEQWVRGDVVFEEGSSINVSGRLVIVPNGDNGEGVVFAENSVSGTGEIRFESSGSNKHQVVFYRNPDLAGTVTIASNQSLNEVVLMSTDALGGARVGVGYSNVVVMSDQTGTMGISTAANSGTLVFNSSTLFMSNTAALFEGKLVLRNTDITFGPGTRIGNQTVGSDSGLDLANNNNGRIIVDSQSTLRIARNGAAVAGLPLIFADGTLDFADPTPELSARLTIKAISGTGTIRTRANPNTGASNLITFMRTSGSFTLDIHFTEEAKSPDQIMPVYTYITGSIPADERTAVLTLPDNNQVESGVYVFRLQQGTGDSMMMPDTDMWYLVADHGAYSRAARAILTTAATAGAEWHYSLDSVSKRMGDLRQEFKAGQKSAHGNLWARASTYDLGANEDFCGSKFTEDVWTFNAGADAARRIGDGTAFLGIFGGYTRAEREFQRLGTGTTDATSGGMYATWLCDSGWFADIVAKADMTRNRFTAVTIDGVGVGGSYDGGILGASLEVGRQIHLGKSKTWWVEPGIQAAVASIKSVHYVTEDGIEVDLKAANSGQYRAQVRFGYAGKGARFHPYGKLAGVYVTTSGGDVIADNRRMHADFDGMRIEAGGGGSYIINPRTQVYLEYEYAKADTYSRKWSFNAGYRRAW